MAKALVSRTVEVPFSSAQRSSSRAADVLPAMAASAIANDFTSARPPKYRRTIGSVSGSPGKSLASWCAAAASARRSWPTAWTSRSAASSSRRPPCARTSAVTKRANSEGLSEADFTSVTVGSLRSRLSRPLPFWPPEWTSTSPMSSAGAVA